MAVGNDRRVLAGLLAGFADRPVSSQTDLDAWARDANALQRRIDTEFTEVSKCLTDDEWRHVRHFLDDPDVRLKDPGSRYTRMQQERFRRVIAKLESA
jgi:hypothetical protein